MSKSSDPRDLSNELLKDILDIIDADPDRSINIDRRAYLSVESFRLPSPPVPSRAHDIGNFRLTCRRFAEIGIPYQFTKVATRFSRHGLDRLDKICSQSHLAKHTRKFSYLVPYFYVEGRDLQTMAGPYSPDNMKAGKKSNCFLSPRASTRVGSPQLSSRTKPMINDESCRRQKILESYGRPWQHSCLYSMCRS